MRQRVYQKLTFTDSGKAEGGTLRHPGEARTVILYQAQRVESVHVVNHRSRVLMLTGDEP